jgi:hypothetical protein
MIRWSTSSIAVWVPAWSCVRTPTTKGSRPGRPCSAISLGLGRGTGSTPTWRARSWSAPRKVRLPRRSRNGATRWSARSTTATTCSWATSPSGRSMCCGRRTRAHTTRFRCWIPTTIGTSSCPHFRVAPSMVATWGRCWVRRSGSVCWPIRGWRSPASRPTPPRASPSARSPRCVCSSSARWSTRPAPTPRLGFVASPIISSSVR